MDRLALLLILACTTARQAPRAESSCSGTVDCGREQLVASDQALQQAIQKQGLAPAFAEVFQDDAKLGYSFGWMEKGHYAAVWRREGGDWKLAVFLQKAAEPQAAAPPAWFVPFRGDREPEVILTIVGIALRKGRGWLPRSRPVWIRNDVRRFCQQPVGSAVSASDRIAV